MAKETIVLVEDDETLAKVTNEELVDSGFEVFLARDGEEGLAMVKEKLPDLVLLDLMLPKINGFTVLEELKKSPHTNTVPVIIMTALGSDEDIKKGLRLGAADYIVKSQHALVEIVDKIKEFLASGGGSAELPAAKSMQAMKMPRPSKEGAKKMTREN